jgi:hypothetical protein
MLEGGLQGRANLIERLSRTKPAESVVGKSADETKLRYRAHSRMLNRKRQAEGKLKINSKPVLRIMECPELGTVSGRCPGRTQLNRTVHPTLVYILATIVIAGAGFADCTRGRATARSGGAEVVVKRPSAALAYKPRSCTRSQCRAR